MDKELLVDTFSNRLNYAMELRCLKQADLVEKTKLSKQQISQYVNGKFVAKQNALFALSKALNVDIAWLMGFDVPIEKSTSSNQIDSNVDINTISPVDDSVKIPILGEVAAGAPIFAEENYIGEVLISVRLAQTGDFFALKIRGDSMSPRISEGDIVIVRQQDYADNGDIIIVLIGSDTATCKKIIQNNVSITLIPFNPAYEPKTYTLEEVFNLPIKILGKVIENRQKY